MDDNGKLLHRKPVYKGRVVDLSVNRVRLPNGTDCELEMIRHPGAAAVVPVTDDGHVVLVRQYRHAAGGWLVEVPAGKLDAGEAPEVCARRETEEETGYRPGVLEPLGAILTAPGFTDEQIWLFLARELEPATQSLEADEALTVVRMPLAAAVEEAHAGLIRDAKSVCALLRAAAWLGTQGTSGRPSGLERG